MTLVMSIAIVFVMLALDDTLFRMFVEWAVIVYHAQYFSHSCISRRPLLYFRFVSCYILPQTVTTHWWVLSGCYLNDLAVIVVKQPLQLKLYPKILYIYIYVTKWEYHVLLHIQYAKDTFSYACIGHSNRPEAILELLFLLFSKQAAWTLFYSFQHGEYK